MSTYREGYEHGRQETLREIAKLRGLVRELLRALQYWADSKESPELDDLCARAKKEGAP